MPEMTVRRFLFGNGVRYRLHVKQLKGTPDIVMKKRKAVIFVNSCFWHQHPGCKNATIPKTRSEYWHSKFEKNAARDAAAIAELEDKGYRIAVIWECGLEKEPRRTESLRALLNWVKGGTSNLEL